MYVSVRCMSFLSLAATANANTAASARKPGTARSFSRWEVCRRADLKHCEIERPLLPRRWEGFTANRLA